MEQWKDIPGYEGIYQASTEGRIRTCEGKTTSNARYPVRKWKQRILKQKTIQADGYRKDFRVSLWKDGKQKDYLVARLIAMTWVDGYSNNLTVNHIDGNFQNNRKDNLEWLSRKENIRDAFQCGLYDRSKKQVRLTDQNDQYIDFSSMAEASRYLSRSNGYISSITKSDKNVAKAIDGELFFVEVLKSS